jgi:hypothetical protein
MHLQILFDTGAGLQVVLASVPTKGAYSTKVGRYGI